MAYYAYRIVKNPYHYFLIDDIVMVLFGSAASDGVPKLDSDVKVVADTTTGRTTFCSNDLEYVEMKRGDRFILTYVPEISEIAKYRGYEVVLETDLDYRYGTIKVSCEGSNFTLTAMQLRPLEVITEEKKCICNIMDLMTNGCKCGGK